MSKLIYQLDEKPAGKVLWLSTMQWFIFMIANLITIPIVLGHAFALTEYETAMMTSRTLLLCGMVCFLQALVGHKYPILEGPAGMWWGVFLILLQMRRDGGGSGDLLLRELELGLMAGSMIFILLAVCNLIGKIKGLFTPAVTGTFLILLAIQVSKSLLQGMLGIGFQGSETVKPLIALLSVLLIGLMIGVMKKGKGIVQNISVLIGLLAGWGLYAVLGLVSEIQSTETGLVLPEIFPFGSPVMNWGIVVTSAITSVILLSNLIASIQVFAKVSGVPATNAIFSRGVLVSGIGTFLAGCFGTIGIVPQTAAASLVSLTGIASRLPFLLSSILVALLGLFPQAGQWLATIPAPVGYAVLFTVFCQLLGFGLRDIQSLSLNQRDIFIVGFSILTGSGSLFIDGKAWAEFPSVFGFILGNGLIVGVIMVIVLEHLIFRKTKKEPLYSGSSQITS